MWPKQKVLYKNGNNQDFLLNLSNMGSAQWPISPMIPSLLILYDGRLWLDLERFAQYEVMLAIFAVCWDLASSVLFFAIPPCSVSWMKSMNCVHRKLVKLWFSNPSASTWARWPPDRAPGHIRTSDLVSPSHWHLTLSDTFSILTRPDESHTLFAEQSPGCQGLPVKDIAFTLSDLI